MLNRFLSPTYMSNVVSESCEDMKISQCLIHGNPVANSVFLVNKEKVTAILDWTRMFKFQNGVCTTSKPF